MSTEDLDALLERMPKIAGAVNAFNSEVVQQEAFVSLIAAFSGKTVRSLSEALAQVQYDPAANDPSAEARDVQELAPKLDNAATGKRRKRNGVSKGSDWTLLRDLDLHPTGKQSFEDFANEKQAKSMEDRYALAVYYVEEILGLSPITKDHVGTVFRRMPGWQEPKSVQAGLRTASNRKSTINSTSMDNLSITPAGRNFVEHKLPAKVAAK